MNGSKVQIDTNICIYLLNGDQILADLLQDQDVYISIITEIELFAFHGNDDSSIEVLNAFMDAVSIIELNSDVKKHSIKIRKDLKLKIPDSIIAASALASSLPVITADKAFKKVTSLNLVLYDNINT